jgi:hypothetical protein
MSATREAYRRGGQSLERLVDTGTVDTRMARSRFLRISAGAVFGAAATAFLPRYAEAHCPSDDRHPCFGFHLCQPSDGCNTHEADCCDNNDNVCAQSCNAGGIGCPSGNSCWYCCHSGERYKCCDCCRDAPECSDPCICRFHVGTCSCSTQNCWGPAGC